MSGDYWTTYNEQLALLFVPANFIWLLLIYIVSVAPLSGVFTKAGRSWFAAFVPIYNVYVTLKISGKPGWWWLVFWVPILGLILAIIMWYSLAKSFGKGGGFTVGLLLLNWIFLLILWLGSAIYLGPYGSRNKPIVPSRYSPPATA